MEFNEKLQYLRKQKGLTQEELASSLYVSRAAVSKWESGRGYPGLDTLKVISKFFEVSIDDLLSGEEVLVIAQEDNKEKERHLRDLVFGLLDISAALLLFLPFFAQRIDGILQEVSLLTLTAIAPWLRVTYFAFVIGIIAFGILLLSLQNCQNVRWMRSKTRLSLAMNALGTLIFIISQQPYASVLLFLFLTIKAVILLKK